MPLVEVGLCPAAKSFWNRESSWDLDNWEKFPAGPSLYHSCTCEAECPDILSHWGGLVALLQHDVGHTAGTEELLQTVDDLPGHVHPLLPPGPGRRQPLAARLLGLGGDVGRVTEQDVHRVVEPLLQTLDSPGPDHLHHGLVLACRGSGGFTGRTVEISQQEVTVRTFETRLWSDR